MQQTAGAWNIGRRTVVGASNGLGRDGPGRMADGPGRTAGGREQPGEDDGGWEQRPAVARDGGRHAAGSHHLT